MNISIPIANTIQFIDQTQVSPLITHAKVKVCYVGQKPNRNDTVITKDVATEMGKMLPGSPVVGFYNKDTEDFDQHKQFTIEDGEIKMIDLTRPYGFVPTNAQVWFEKFNDNGEEHEYLCTECYIWTSAYPESQRVIDKGSNQSMELNKVQQSGFWTNDQDTGHRVFIYNDALIEKLCLLGDDIEPCFEGAQVKTEFSLENDPAFQEFKTTMFSMIQEIMDKGGSPMDGKTKDLTPETEHACGGTAPIKEEEDKKKKKQEYNLDEIPEYTELMSKYTALQNDYSALVTEKETLNTELTQLREFKAVTDRQNKQNMIDSFYMLTDEDKKDCVEHIDEYSIDDIEAKLSIICVKNKVDFSLEKNDDKPEESPEGLFNLNNLDDDNAPAWIKAVRETANK